MSQGELGGGRFCMHNSKVSTRVPRRAISPCMTGVWRRRIQIYTHTADIFSFTLGRETSSRSVTMQQASPDCPRLSAPISALSIWSERRRRCCCGQEWGCSHTGGLRAGDSLNGHKLRVHKVKPMWQWSPAQTFQNGPSWTQKASHLFSSSPPPPAGETLGKRGGGLHKLSDTSFHHLLAEARKEVPLIVQHPISYTQLLTYYFLPRDFHHTVVGSQFIQMQLQRFLCSSSYFS